MRPPRDLTEHPSSVGAGYREHLRSTSSLAFRLMTGGLACVIHGLLPFVFVRTASTRVAQLHEQLVMNRRDVSETRCGAVSSSTAQPAIFAGVTLAICLALVAELFAGGLRMLMNVKVSPVSPVLCAVLLGVLWRNTVGLREQWSPGLQWVTDTLLRVGIALVGLRLSLSGIAATSALAVPVAAACVVTAIATSMVIGRWLGLSHPLRLLLAAGTAVCGCTAIVALTPIIRARAQETGMALTCVVLLGCTGMLLYPWLAHTVFDDSMAAGVFLGTAIHDTSQVVGAALIYAQQFKAEDTVAIASFTKLLRNLSLLVLVPLFAVWARNASPEEAGVKRSSVLPTFLICFVALALLRTAGDAVVTDEQLVSLWQRGIGIALGASELLLACGMTAVGLSVSLSELRGIGGRVLLAALAVALAVAVCSLAVTLLLDTNHLRT